MGGGPTARTPTPQECTLPWEHPQHRSILNLRASQPGTSSSHEHPYPRSIPILGPSSSQEHPQFSSIPTWDFPHPETIPIPGVSPSWDLPHPGAIPIPGASLS